LKSALVLICLNVVTPKTWSRQRVLCVSMVELASIFELCSGLFGMGL